MSAERVFLLKVVADACQGRLADPAKAGVSIARVATVEDATPDAVTWVMDAQHAKAVASCRAGGIVGTAGLLGDDPRGIIVADPERAIIEVLKLFEIPVEPPAPGVHPPAVVGAGARLGTGVRVGALAVIGRGAEIGDDSVIHEGVSIGADVRIGCRTTVYDRCVIYDRCRVGNGVIIHSGAVIGADGFGYIFRDSVHRKIPQIGVVVIEDDVEIGANTCIDRAKVGETRVGRGSKIDNLVMVAHNVQLGPLCVLTGQVGISGSVELGVGVVMGGQSGVVHGVKVGDGVRVAAQSCVTGDVPGGRVVLGMPARDRMEVLRDQARVRKLSMFFEQVARIEKRVANLEATADHREPR